MRIVLIMLGVCLIAGVATSQVTTAEPESVRTYLKKYRGKTPVPDDLYRAYETLAEAMKRADQDRIEALSLPGSIRISTGRRPGTSIEYGTDLNLPFLRERFMPQILVVRKERDDVYLLRTGTSYLRFVATRAGAWRLYHYGDKPIQ